MPFKCRGKCDNWSKSYFEGSKYCSVCGIYSIVPENKRCPCCTTLLRGRRNFSRTSKHKGIAPRRSLMVNNSIVLKEDDYSHYPKEVRLEVLSWKK